MTQRSVSRPRVTVLGSANMDLVGLADRLPTAGETVLGNGFTMTPGGKGANQAIAASRAGADVTMIAAVGDDAFGPVLLDALRASGVRVDLVRVVPGPSGVALIAVDAGGENQILVVPGANVTLESLSEAEISAVTGAQALVCQLEIPLTVIAQAADAARSAGVPVILNAAPARALPAEVLDRVDLLVVNAGEAAALSGRPDVTVQDVAAAVPDLNVLTALVPRVVVTLGAAGAVYGERSGERFAVPAPVITAVDTTAAGDAFVGALTVAWIEGRPMRDALRWACAAGAASAMVLGAQASLPTRAAIEELSA